MKVIPYGMPEPLLGDYGNNTTPVPESFAEVMISGNTISFTSGSGRTTESGVNRELESGFVRRMEAESTDQSIADSLFQFRDARFKDAMLIRVESESGKNDGDYTIASRGVSRGEILLEENSLASETAAAAGQVTIYRLLYKPNITEGCPFCGTLNSR
jgi:hypothetical protein